MKTNLKLNFKEIDWFIGGIIISLVILGFWVISIGMLVLTSMYPSWKAIIMTVCFLSMAVSMSIPFPSLCEIIRMTFPLK